MSGDGAGDQQDNGDQNNGEEEEEASEKEEEEEEMPSFGKDGRPQGPTPGFEVLPDHSAEGKVEEREGYKIYQTGKPGTVAGVLLLSDFWGWNSGRVRAVADYLAKALSAIVVVPRLLDKPPLQGGTDEEGLPPDFDLDAKQKDLQKWLMRYVWNSFQPKIHAAVTMLRNQGIKRIGGVGFCFGVWALCKASESMGEFVASTLFYPSVHVVEETLQGNPILVAKRLRGPTLLITARDDPQIYWEQGPFFQANFRNYMQDSEAWTFENMQHGWVLRGDAQDGAVKEEAEKAMTYAAKYLRKFLWPPPLGANAATLRLMCQDGDADMVNTLLSAGVPAGGKDAVDTIGLLPLHYAAKCNTSVYSIKLLVEYEADANAVGGIAKEAAIHVAASLGNSKAVKALLQQRADMEKVDKGGQTALHYAARYASLPVIKLLLKAGASMYARDSPAQQLPIHLAAWYGAESIVMHMLLARMDVDPLDLRHQTPQKRAKQQGFDAVADLFDAERQRREEEAFEAANAKA